ncbi:AT-hook motif nuclear-localized protein 1-like [Rutidosis leptorrhynchoides]|uniref:AT-hook motif nuclear-localized protein 1-like n=1 Tax=Rutidosis leptorrhynchoides TaxID=125765 RepID=UPI003A9A549D
MEGREVKNSTSDVTVVGSDAPSDYHKSPTTEQLSRQITITGPTGVTTPVVPTPTQPPLGVMPLSMKKKRGRPRKYGLDGSTVTNKALSPKPISSAGSSPVIDFSSPKRGKSRLPLAGKHHQHSPRIGTESLGDWFSCSDGANFTPHIINVNTGEDVTMKVISFSQQGPRAICILSANGVISSVTLRQPDSSGGTLTYEGRFEILSLAGSFTPYETVGTRNRSGGMSVSLASPDGRVVGGSVAGLLVAATPVQIVVGSFLTGNQREQKTPNTPKPETVTPRPFTVTGVPISTAETKESYPATVKSDITSLSYRGNSWSAYSASESRKKETEN